MSILLKDPAAFELSVGVNIQITAAPLEILLAVSTDLSVGRCKFIGHAARVIQVRRLGGGGGIAEERFDMLPRISARFRGNDSIPGGIRS